MAGVFGRARAVLRPPAPRLGEKAARQRRWLRANQASTRDHASSAEGAWKRSGFVSLRKACPVAPRMRI
jgi:hypothetical protein